jgi:hypothetical protein
MALQDLMDRPYWFRLWIIQEVIMGSTATWIRCGKASIDWATFCTGIAVLQEYLWLVKDHCLQVDVIAAKANVQRVWRTTSLHLVYQDLSVLSQRFSEKDNELSFERLLDLGNSETVQTRETRCMLWSVSCLLQSRLVYVRITRYQNGRSTQRLQEHSSWLATT